MHPILFKIGSFYIYTYGVLVFLGILAGYFVSFYEAKKNKIEPNVFEKIVFWTILWGFIGARIFYILVEWDEFLKTPFKVLFSRSGFVFYGGLIFGFLTSYFLVKKNKLNFLKFADIFSLGIPLSHAIGRLGCFSYGCCYGKPTNSFIGVVFPENSPVIYTGQKVIPTQLIESFFLFVIFFLLSFLKKNKKFDGQVFFTYLFLYSLVRFFVEFFRGDPRGGFWIFSTSQWLSIFIFLISIFFYYFKLKSIN